MLDPSWRHRRDGIAGAVVRKPLGKYGITDRVQFKNVRRRDRLSDIGRPHSRIAPPQMIRAVERP